MRTTKVLAFSVPPDFESEIVRHAKLEHRTISEYLREAVRHYMTLRQFEATQKTVAARMKKKKLGPMDAERQVERLRKRP